MFGRRPDGRRLVKIDPIQAMTAYLMPQRCDAQVWTPQELDYDKIAGYIQKQRDKGHVISFMSVIIASFIRTTCHHPEINRFVMNKQIFARNELTASFMVLKRNSHDDVDASAVKVKFDPTDTIYDVAERIEAAIAENREPPPAGNLTEQIARFILSAPFVPTLLVGLIRLLDRYGILPRAIIDASPFHTSFFITNMASLGINYIYHHIYNFGTTSLFFSMGKIKRTPVATQVGGTAIKRMIPLGVVSDERICNGASYAKMYSTWRRYAENPELLEQPPEEIKTEVMGVPEWVKHPKKKAKQAETSDKFAQDENKVEGEGSEG